MNRLQSPASMAQHCCYLITTLLITLTLVQHSFQWTNSEEAGLKRAAHNIMRIGRTSGHNIMRFGRAGHNIMHFGKRDSAEGPVNGGGLPPPAPELPLNLVGPVPVGYAEPQVELDADYQQSLYQPYRRFNTFYNKKADGSSHQKDNVFMHFG